MRPNLWLSKKSTNSRMGKGKGNPTRRAFQSKIFSPLIEFQGVPHEILKGFNRYLIFKTGVRTVVINKPAKFFNNLGLKQGIKPLFQKYNCL